MLPTLQSICESMRLDLNDVLTIYPYGSRVYGTNSPKSDYDYVVIAKDNGQPYLGNAEKENINLTIYTKESFAEKVCEHSVSALECIFLPANTLLVSQASFDFRLDKKILREAFSAKASNSWVKAKKKFEVVQDRNVYIAKKSLFHCLRIIDFGIQIATHGKIVNYSSSNAIWRDIANDSEDTWDPYKVRYQAFYNEQMTKFRKLAPK